MICSAQVHRESFFEVYRPHLENLCRARTLLIEIRFLKAFWEGSHLDCGSIYNKGYTIAQIADVAEMTEEQIRGYCKNREVDICIKY